MTAPDPRPGGCLHGPGARPGVCPNCGTVVDEAELARVAGTAGTTCECGHTIDRHEGVGNWGCEAYSPPAIGKSPVCPCTRKPSQIAAEAVAAGAEGRADSRRATLPAYRAMEDRAEAAERRLAEVEGKVRAVGRELQGLVSRYTRAPGENGDRVADLLSEDAYRIGSELLAALSDPAPEADAPVPQRDALWGKACPFCPIIEGDSAATIVERGERHVAFVPLGPHVPGHVLFVPIEHLPDATVNPARTGEVVAQASRYVAEQGIDANIITSVGTAAMQSVPHLHVHVVPRGPDDGLPTRWPWLPVPQRDAGVREAVLAWADEAPEHTPGLDLLRQIVTPVDSAPATREAEDRGESS